MRLGVGGAGLIIALKVPEGVSIHEFISDVVSSRRLKGGLIIGIGGLDYAEVGYYSPTTREYIVTQLRASTTVLEVTSLIGNYFVKPDGSVSIHIHVNLATSDGVKGGHLIKGVAKPFLEVFLLEGGVDLASIFTHR
jgi:predicted DNA-binding protein with PD1-like motif